jgi:hypothetical protein
MIYRTNNRTYNGKIILYIIILLLGLWLGFNTSDPPSPPPGGENVAMDNTGGINSKEGSAFIESRSLVNFRLVKEATLGEVKEMFRLSVNEDVILQLNKQLSRKYLEKKVPQGTQLKLFIQSRMNPGFQVEE